MDYGFAACYAHGYQCFVWIMSSGVMEVHYFKVAESAPRCWTHSAITEVWMNKAVGEEFHVVLGKKPFHRIAYDPLAMFFVIRLICSLHHSSSTIIPRNLALETFVILLLLRCKSYSLVWLPLPNFIKLGFNTSKGNLLAWNQSVRDAKSYSISWRSTGSFIPDMYTVENTLRVL